MPAKQQDCNPHGRPQVLRRGMDALQQPSQVAWVPVPVVGGRQRQGRRGQGRTCRSRRLIMMLVGAAGFEPTTTSRPGLPIASAGGCGRSVCARERSDRGSDGRRWPPRLLTAMLTSRLGRLGRAGRMTRGRGPGPEPGLDPTAYTGMEMEEGHRYLVALNQRRSCQSALSGHSGSLTDA